MACDLIVIPRSRSKSILSKSCACCSRAVTEPVASSKRSAKVLFPWSMCAIMQKLRMFFMAFSKAKILIANISDFLRVLVSNKIIQHLKMYGKTVILS